MNDVHPGLRYRAVTTAITAPHGAIPLARHAPRSGARALVIDCGTGEPALDLARLVGAKGSVVGLDGDDELLEAAVSDARANGIENVAFVRASGASHLFDGTWDLVFARFAPAFSDAPRAALAKVRRALKPGGRLLLVTWNDLACNRWVEAPWCHARRYLTPAVDPPGCAAGGPFLMSDRRVVRAMLEAAGFADVGVESVHATVMVGRTVDEAIDYQLELGPVGDMVRRAGDPRLVRSERLRASLREAIEPYTTRRGVLMDSSSLCFTASAS